MKMQVIASSRHCAKLNTLIRNDLVQSIVDDVKSRRLTDAELRDLINRLSGLWLGRDDD